MRNILTAPTGDVQATPVSPGRALRGQRARRISGDWPVKRSRGFAARLLVYIRDDASVVPIILFRLCGVSESR